MNILSIDFDWIMQPTIRAYNDLSYGYNRLGPAEIWDNIFSAMPGFNPQCDLNYFTDLYFLLKRYLKNLNVEDVYIGMNHDELYKFMEQLGAKKYSVYNIDHHHDLGYRLEEQALSDQPLTMANWATKAHENLNMYKYTWIHNTNSGVPEYIPETLKYTHTTDLNILDGVRIDKIFICPSWEWVPLKYQNLFAILVSLFDDLEKK